jgi:hypothetical protein
MHELHAYTREFHNKVLEYGSGSVDVHCATSASDSATRSAEIGVFDPLGACVQVLPGPAFASHRRSSCWSFVVSCSFLVKQSHRLACEILFHTAHTVKLFHSSHPNLHTSAPHRPTFFASYPLKVPDFNPHTSATRLLRSAPPGDSPLCPCASV